MYSRTCCIRNCTRTDTSQHKKDTSPAELSNLSKLNFGPFWSIQIVKNFEHFAHLLVKDEASSIPSRRNFKTQQTPVYLDLFEENLAREITILFGFHVKFLYVDSLLVQLLYTQLGQCRAASFAVSYKQTRNFLENSAPFKVLRYAGSSLDFGGPK